METIIAFLGWKYVKNITDGKYHHYKCKELDGILNRKKYSLSNMVQDLENNPYSVTICECCVKAL